MEQQQRDLRSGMHVHIEELTVPPGKPHELTEQVVSINGNIEGAKVTELRRVGLEIVGGWLYQVF
jgi:hypothetical protein